MSIKTDESEWETNRRLYRWLWEHLPAAQRTVLTFMVVRWWLKAEGVRPDATNQPQVFKALWDRGLIERFSDSSQRVPTDQGLKVVEESVRTESGLKGWLK